MTDSFKEYLSKKKINEGLTPDKVKLLGLVDDYGQKMHFLGKTEIEVQHGASMNIKGIEKDANNMMSKIKKLIEKI